MGQSTDGILAYGWDLGSESDDEYEWSREFLEELDEEFEGDVENMILSKLGYNGPGDYNSKYDFIKNLPFELITHCSCEYPMYILTLKTTNWSASRGYPIDVNEAVKIYSDEPPDYDAQLYDAASKLGLNPPQGPKLLLASLWC